MLPYPITPDMLIWDGWNRAHIARHDVTQQEVEEVCEGRYIVRQGHSGRFIVIGLTSINRMLAVILEASEEKRFYVVTARSAGRRERRIYRGGDER